MKREKAIKFFDTVKRLRLVIDDTAALEHIDIYPEWKIGDELAIGDRVKYKDRLYKVVQAHTTQEGWIPTATPALFEPIDIVNEGTLSNPIIAAAGMTYFKDKYYLDETDGKVYLCTRDDSNGNGTTLQFVPSALVGVYFTLAE